MGYNTFLYLSMPFVVYSPESDSESSISLHSESLSSEETPNTSDNEFITQDDDCTDDEESYVDNTSEYDTPDEEYLSDDDQNNYTVLVTAFTDELFDILWKKNESYQLTIKIKNCSCCIRSCREYN